MHKLNLSKDFEISRVIHGHWRLKDWNLSSQNLLKLTQQAVDLGITTFDHADIYGDHECEKLFGNALILNKALRKDIQIITKCGIKLLSEKYPERRIKHYDYSYKHIIWSVENSLKNLNTDYIDLLLLHRPAPFFDPYEVARAFFDLKQSGKVLHFGVSNFNPLQFEMLNSCLNDKLVTNQVEISPYCLEHFENGNIDFFLREGIKPLAWSPLAGGNLLNPTDDKGKRINQALNEVANELNIDSIDKVIYSWLFNHPAQIVPIAGTSKIGRLKSAIEAITLEMPTELWYKIFTASKGSEMP